MLHESLPNGSYLHKCHKNQNPMDLLLSKYYIYQNNMVLTYINVTEQCLELSFVAGENLWLGRGSNPGSFADLRTPYH